VKKLICIVMVLLVALAGTAQDSTYIKHNPKNDRKEARRQKVNTLVKQAEEGVLVYRKQSIFGLQGRTNGYGAFYELGRMKTIRKTTTYRIDFNEIKSPKEEKAFSNSFFGNSFIYGKINHFYPVTIGIGQQYMLGQKGNKNGVAVSAVYSGGLSVGLLRPYYIEVQDIQGDRFIKYSAQDSAAFVNGPFIGGGGLSKGWNDIKIKPGAFLKAALRFDYGRFNETVAAIEAGMSIEAYGSKIPIMLFEKEKQLFFQGYISILLGRRR
jgi:hypothetical protein